MRISDWSSDVCSSDLALAGTHLVPMPRRQRKTATAVVQSYACSWYDDTGSEALVVGLYERHHHAVAVGRCQVNRSALRWQAGSRCARGVRVDELGPFAQVAAIEQMLGQFAHAGRLAHVFVQVGKCQFDCFDRQVEKIKRLTVTGWLDCVKPAQSHQGRYARP